MKKKIFALVLLTVFVNQIFFPTVCYALTSGPSQPEVQSFEPVSTTEMVDLFTGDFNYNIPLLDVEGYPVNISYHSGITMDQEASWVGLGWNINPGVINRNMRGIPDDFDGDIIQKDFNMRPNRTFGIKAGPNLEVFGQKKPKLGNLSFSLGIKYNNYNGVGIENSVNISISSGGEGKPGLNGSLGIASSNDEGLTIQPSVGLSMKMSHADKGTNSLGLRIGSSFNSRSGLKQLTINTSYSTVLQGDMGSKTLASAGGSWDFGTPTYVPQLTMPFRNFSITASFTGGLAILAAHPNATIQGYYSSQTLNDKTSKVAAYGYLNREKGTSRSILDFNREKDANFTTNTIALPLANQTFDLFSVSGQGAGGSYRAFRSDYSYVHDPYVSNPGFSSSFGAEIGAASGFHLGIDVNVVNVNSNSGNWSSKNNAISKLAPRNFANDPLYEKFYFKEANEKTVVNEPEIFNKVGGVQSANYIEIADAGGNQPPILTTTMSNNSNAATTLSDQNYRTKRENRNSSFNIIPRKYLKQVGIEDNDNILYASANPNHIGEITTMGSDGKRFVYGIAAYNTLQEDVTFAVGKKIYGSSPGLIANSEGLVYYPGDEDSKDNSRGLDNYYSKTTLPPFSHSFLLTSVLDPEYIDNDNVRGPSDGDYGNYTKFRYEKIENFRWRTPLGYKTASHSEGLEALDHDDKASYVYGEKEVYYLNKIETKNYVAIFTLNNREDALGVVDKNGEIDQGKKLKLLRKISLFSKKDLNKPIKEVHFVYNYELCKYVPNNKHSDPYQRGKLTLKEIYFTYGTNKKGRFSPYIFKYNADDPLQNPNYSTKSQDRWGNYKPNNLSLPNGDYPYVTQDENLANQYSSVWHLKSITLPSGGKITIDYESDDYRYVQNKEAMRMFPIVSTSNGGTIPGKSDLVDPVENPELFIMADGSTNSNDYGKKGDWVYFKCLVYYNGAVKPNYVTGYGKIEDIIYSNPYIKVKFEAVKISDNSNEYVNPIVRTGIQFGRKYLPDIVNDPLPGVGSSGGEPDFGEDLLKQLIGSITNFVNGLKDPNEQLYNKNHARSIELGKSFIRLNCPNKIKYGGGTRVKKISFSNEWDNMTAGIGDENKQVYGQEYDYTLPDGTSSGVAAYEPIIGNEENPWRQPLFVEQRVLWGPDEDFYIEEPFGESFFPSPVVGYSRVTVKNLKPVTNITRRGTGYIVNEFFTARDFPTITQRTLIRPDNLRKRPSTASIKSLLKINYYDYCTASQGYFIETNDMHGKPKTVSVYQEKQDPSELPLSKIEYRYKVKPYLSNSFRLDNAATVIDEFGKPKTGDIGVNMDFVTDFRRSETNTESSSIMYNTDGFYLVIFAIAPTLWPGYSKEKTLFRSSVTTKVVQRFGLLEEVIKLDLGSQVSTKNLAYDAVTGEVILTETINNFNDPVYSLTVPAHWHYNEMGPASKNLGVKFNNASINLGTFNVANAKKYFVKGDELLVRNSSSTIKAWVTEVGGNQVKIVDYYGQEIHSTGNYIEVIRSGRRNLQNTPIASITTLSNPLNNIQNNLFEKVIQAQAIEYGNKWKTHCECLEGSDYTTNPYINGKEGSWHVLKTYTYLTGRDQTQFEANTNIRDDGFFNSFSPFYKFSNNKCEKDPTGWTFASEVTLLSPAGFELENQDAIGIFSAATYGYNHTLPTAVAKNAQYGEVGFDNFEDYTNCKDMHFKVSPDVGGFEIIDYDSHTGRKSIKVGNGATAEYYSQVYNECPPCSFNVEAVNPHQISIYGGTAPYSISWNIVSGNPTIFLSPPPGNGVSVAQGTDYWEFELTVTDAEGCTVIKDFNNCSTSELEFVTGSVSNPHQILISGGQSPYNVTWDIISGTPNIASLNPPINDEISIDFGIEDWIIEFTIVDANGCITEETIVYTPCEGLYFEWIPGTSSSNDHQILIHGGTPPYTINGISNGPIAGSGGTIVNVTYTQPGAGIVIEWTDLTYVNVNGNTTHCCMAGPPYDICCWAYDVEVIDSNGCIIEQRFQNTTWFP